MAGDYDGRLAGGQVEQVLQLFFPKNILSQPEAWYRNQANLKEI